MEIKRIAGLLSLLTLTACQGAGPTQQDDSEHGANRVEI